MPKDELEDCHCGCGKRLLKRARRDHRAGLRKKIAAIGGEIAKLKQFIQSKLRTGTPIEDSDDSATSEDDVSMKSSPLTIVDSEDEPHFGTNLSPFGSSPHAIEDIEARSTHSRSNSEHSMNISQRASDDGNDLWAENASDHLPNEIDMAEAQPSQGRISPAAPYEEEIIEATRKAINQEGFPLRASDDESDIEDNSEQVLRSKAEALFEEMLGDQWRQEMYEFGAPIHTEHLRDNHSPSFLPESECLTDADRDNISAFALKLDTNMSRETYKKLVKAFSHRLPLKTEFLLYRRIDVLSGLKPEIYDCCIKSCCAYLGEYEDLDTCPFCKEPRFNSKGKPRQRYWYLPIIPRLQGLFYNKDLAASLSTYRANYKMNEPSSDEEGGTVSDLYDSEHYKELLGQNVEIGDEQLSHRYFDQPTDICLGMSLDGVALFRRRQGQCTATPVLTVNFSLHPAHRYRLPSVLFNAIIPGPHQPVDLNSYMVPLQREAHKLARGVRTFNAFTMRSFVLRAYWIRIWGDMVAMYKALCIKGHKGFCHCRRCLMQSVLATNPGGKGKSYYHPLALPKKPRQALQTRDPRNLPLRTHAGTLEHIKEINTARNKTAGKRLGMIYGISGTSFIFRMPGMCFVRSAPLDLMHLGFENISKMLQQMQSSQVFRGVQGPGTGQYILSTALWKVIGAEIDEAVKNIPSTFVRSIPNIANDRSSWTSEAWCFWTLYLAPILLRDRLPQRYYKHMLLFSEIIALAIKLDITHAEIDLIEEKCIKWVKDYER